MKIEETIDNYLNESGSRSDFGKAMNDVINYLNRAINEASKEGISELKNFKRQWTFYKNFKRNIKCNRRY